MARVTFRRIGATAFSASWSHAVSAEWLEQSVPGTAILAVLKRNHGYQGSHSSLYSMIMSIRGETPPAATVPLVFALGEAAQVDFGAGPQLLHPDGSVRRTWAFVMTLCFSRPQYVEFVWDQTVATWLDCHRRAFEWFTSVPSRLVIDFVAGHKVGFYAKPHENQRLRSRSTKELHEV